MSWMRRSGYRPLVLRAAGLVAAHEVDPAQPLGPEIRAHHERSVRAAADALGLLLRPLPVCEHPTGLAELAKVGLGEALRGEAAGGDLIWELSSP
jgi:hypothetical protein